MYNLFQDAQLEMWDPSSGDGSFSEKGSAFKGKLEKLIIIISSVFDILYRRKDPSHKNDPLISYSP